jgi:hypothetical protein
MQLKYSRKTLSFQKELTKLDKFVITFTDILKKNKIKYVIVSGYVAILFGRSRHTEDIDIIIEKIPFSRFNILWNELSNKFECINTSNCEDAYGYLTSSLAIRLAEKNTIEPNFEIKFAKNQLDKLALADKILVKLNKYKIFISNIELQISFKLYLGSDKDLEDAKHLWIIFKEKLDKEKLKYFLNLFKIKKRGILDGL